jgi:hypothetical protein
MRYNKLLVLGRSGSGKSASMRNLDPAKTGIINCDKQELIFPSKGYETVMTDGVPDLAASNYVETSKPSSVLATMRAWEAREDLDTIVLDTITHLITAYYITEALGKEFGGYKELGTSFWNIIDFVRTMKKNVVVFGHIDNKFNDMGEKEVTLKAHGNMIDKFETESYFNTLLMAEVRKVEGEIRWDFKTQPDAVVEKIKSPVRFGENNTVERALEKYEPNDLKAIFDKLNKFYS